MTLASPDAPVRPAGDILSRVVRIRLSGQEYRLPVRSIRANREWKERLEATSAGVVDALVQAGDDWEAIASALAQDVGPYIDLLVSYAPDVLSREAIEDLEPDPSRDVIAACREVWLAASPLAAIAIEQLRAEMAQTPDGSLPTSSPPPSTDGPPSSSRIGSPTNSSSPTSTLPATGSRNGAPPTSTNGYSPSEPEPSSPTTARRSSGGAGRSRAGKGKRNGASAAQPSRPQ